MNIHQQMQCNVCDSPLRDPVYDSHSEQSLTSLCQLHPGTTQVWFCSSCGHIQSKVLAQTEKYYASEYKILLNHDDEDQIYEVVDDDVVYRTKHQLAVLNKKLKIRGGQKILDYGCAKATMAKELLQQMPDLNFHFFDVSDMYLTYWERLTTPDNFAINRTPPEWARQFDLVTSYFSLEHIPNPRESVSHIASLLKDDGTLYAIVPDTFGNVADFVVVDHVNHFTSCSITRLLLDAGFTVVDVDNESHRGALVIIARKQGEPNRQSYSVSDLLGDVNALAGFWQSITEQIKQAETANSGPSAIYGAGFYGAFIYAHLGNPSSIQVVLDQNPFQQGRTLFDVPIIAPEDIPKNISTLYVGLNPKIARQVISSQAYLNRDGLQIVYLGDSA